LNVTYLFRINKNSLDLSVQSKHECVHFSGMCLISPKMRCNARLKILCRWLSYRNESSTGGLNLPRTSFPLSMKDNVAAKEIDIQKVLYCHILVFSDMTLLILMTGVYEWHKKDK